MLLKTYYSVYSQKQWKFHYTKSIYLKKTQRTAPCRWIKILSLCFRIQSNRMIFHGLETYANDFLHCWFLAKNPERNALTHCVESAFGSVQLTSNRKIQEEGTWKGKRKTHSQIFLKLLKWKSLTWAHMPADQFYPGRARSVGYSLMLLWQIRCIFICRYKYITEDFISQKKHRVHKDLKFKLDLLFQQAFVHFIFNELLFEMPSPEGSTFRSCHCQHLIS